MRQKGNFWTVRFSHGGQRYELSVGEGNRGEATRKAREVYAQVISGKQLQRAPVNDCPIEDWGSQWLSEIPVRKITRDLYEKYLDRWMVELRTVQALTTNTLAAYSRKRLREVQSKTVRSELSALRQMCVWLVEIGELEEVPEIPKVKGDGTKHTVRHRVKAAEYSPDEIEAILAELPEHSIGQGWPVRARFVVAYETSLRPSTLDKISTPESYTSGAEVLRLSAATDKEGYAREVPLTRRAQDALASVCPPAGLIFGTHRYGEYVTPAALKVLGPGRGLAFTGQHFRSAAITHMLDSGAPLPVVQLLAGHLYTSTTSKYVRPSFRAAEEWMRKRG